VVESAPLLREYTLKAYRGFESLTLRHFFELWFFLFDASVFKASRLYKYNLINRFQSFFDRLAVLISLLCAVHCLLLPVLLVAFPLLSGSLLSDESFHQLLLWVILPTSIISISLARCHHPDRKVLVLVSSGLFVLVFAALIAHEYLPESIDIAMSVIGGILLAIGHIRNFKLCKQSTSNT
jgi:hypothetical protein